VLGFIAYNYILGSIDQKHKEKTHKNKKIFGIFLCKNHASQEKGSPAVRPAPLFRAP
jgi:hypothetical protein